MSKIAVIADKQTTLGFKANGIDSFPFTNKDELSSIFLNIQSKDYAVVFISEDAYKKLEDQISIYEDEAIPSYVIIPTIDKNLGLAKELTEKIIQKAVGMKIEARKVDSNE